VYVVHRAIQQLLQPHPVLTEMRRTPQSRNRGNGSGNYFDFPYNSVEQQKGNGQMA